MDAGRRSTDLEGDTRYARWRWRGESLRRSRFILFKRTFVGASSAATGAAAAATVTTKVTTRGEPIVGLLKDIQGSYKEEEKGNKGGREHAGEDRGLTTEGGWGQLGGGGRRPCRCRARRGGQGTAAEGGWGQLGRLSYLPYFFYQPSVFSLIINQPTIILAITFRISE